MARIDELVEPGEDGFTRRVGGERLELQLQLRRQPHVVGVEQREVEAIGDRDAGVAAATDTGVLATEHGDVPVDRRRDVGGGVGGAVVDDHDLRGGAVWSSAERNASSMNSSASRAATTTDTDTDPCDDAAGVTVSGAAAGARAPT